MHIHYACLYSRSFFVSNHVLMSNYPALYPSFDRAFLLLPFFLSPRYSVACSLFPLPRFFPPFPGYVIHYVGWHSKWDAHRIKASELHACTQRSDSCMYGKNPHVHDNMFTCSRCYDGGDNMLLCDACDQVWHMQCHTPIYTNTPGNATTYRT